jgi:endonuclease/exonuclease/phosphatase (EEP) superfamily protein YafD
MGQHFLVGGQLAAARHSAYTWRMSADALETLPPLAAFVRRWVIAGIVIVAPCSLTACLPFSAPLIDLPSHFIVQYLLGIIVLAALGRYARLGWKSWLALGISAALCLYLLVPWLPLSDPATPAHGKPLRLLQANILFLNKDPARFKQLILDEKPDIIIMAEANSAFVKMLTGLRNNYPYQSILPDDHGSDGIGVVSRLPLKDLRNVVWPGAEMPSQIFSFTWDKQQVHFVNIHTPNPIGDVPGRDATFAGFEKEISRLKGPVIVAGDFNATPWCPALRGIMSRNPRLHNAREGRGLFQSWPTFLPPFVLRIPIDQTLFSDEFTVIDYHLGPDIGSDHLPLVSTLALKGGK